MKRYSLATHILSFTSNDNTINDIFGTVSIGGEGSALDSIRIRLNENLWSTQGFATGGWVHNKNLSKAGTVEITINQLTDAVYKFIQLCNTYYAGDYEGLTITLSNNDGREICECIDCYIQKIPDQEYASTAQNQTWSFTCGKITFK